MSSYVSWREIRAEHVERAGGEDAVKAGKEELLAEVVGHRLGHQLGPGPVHRPKTDAIAQAILTIYHGDIGIHEDGMAQ